MTSGLWAPSEELLTPNRRVLIKRGEWIDESRDGRAVPYKIYYPEGDDILPVIMWSHGLGGTRDGAGFLARFMAGHGYIHVHIQHDGSDDSLWRNEKDKHPWDAIRERTPIPWEDTKLRYQDVPFAWDMLAQDTELLPRMNLEQRGMCGHSFGSLTTQIMAGQLTGLNDNSIEQFKMDGLRAGILYSPTLNFRLKETPDQEIYGAMDAMPLLFITGTEDNSPVEGFDYTHRVAVFDHSGRDDHQLMVLDGADHMVFNGSRGQLPDYEGIEDHKRALCLSSLAWWEHYLKSNPAAEDWISSQGLGGLTGTNGMVKTK